MRVPAAAAVLLAFLLCAPGAGAQEIPPPRFTLEVFGGAATFGRFLEQRNVRGERELTAETAPVVGGALGIRAWRSASVRLAFTWAPTELEFEDDTPLGVGPGDPEEGLRDLDVFVGSLEVLSFFIGEERRISPYGLAGVAGGWWRLDEVEAGVGSPILAAADDDTDFAFGGMAGLGVQLRATPRFLVRLEATRIGLGNPFDGDDGFAAVGGVTVDEPEIVNVFRYTLGVGYTFGAR